MPLRPSNPLALSDIEIRSLLLALGDDPGSRLPKGRPDLVSALVRAKRALRIAQRDDNAPDAR